MSDPFQTALEAIFAGPGSSAASFLPAGGGAAIATRVIRGGPDVRTAFGEGRLVMRSDQVQLMRAAVPAPAEGDAVRLLDDAGTPVADGAFLLASEPMIDLEGLTWTCDLQPVG
jgi:hypothetical protein